jgi:hypothetical protein
MQQILGVFLLASSVFAYAGDVRTDYDHGATFTQYRTYSWGNVQTADPLYVARIKAAVDGQLQAKGWQSLPSGGDVTIFATSRIHNQEELQTIYDGWGGGWGGGWGWSRWGWGGGWGPGGFGQSTTTTTSQPVGSLVIDVFDANNKNLLWRGIATADLSTHAEKNSKSLDRDISKMFKSFPPKPNGR